MRVITGRFKGRILKAPKGIRPVTAMIKEAVFSILGATDWASASVLDIFAGAGNFGVEASSRGCDAVTFVDASPASRVCITENMRGAAVPPEIVIMDMRRAIKNLSKNDRRFTIIFADPPFDQHLGNDVVRLLDEYPLLDAGGTLMLRVRDDEPVSFPARWHVEERRYGDSAVYLGRKEDER